MVDEMTNRETSELGGEGVAVYLEGLISWVFTPVLKGSWSRGHAIFSLVTSAHFCRAVIMWGEASVNSNEQLT
jgi:hypothetical protein